MTDKNEINEIIRIIMSCDGVEGVKTLTDMESLIKTKKQRILREIPLSQRVFGIKPSDKQKIGGSFP